MSYRQVKIMSGIPTYQNYIDGRWRTSAGGAFFDNIDPACGEVINRFPASEEVDVLAAIDAAHMALPGWMELPTSARGALLEAAAAYIELHVDAWAEELTQEEGKPLAASRDEWLRTAATFCYYAAEALSWSGQTFPSSDPKTSIYSLREPLGVVSVITPWNFPASIPARKIAPALAAGNTIVFKPSSIAPMTALRLVQSLEHAGVPAGVVNLVTGDVPALGDALITDPRVRAVTFTGSTAAGRAIHASAALTTRVQLELGGKNALVVLDDADLDQAVSLIVQGGLSLSGQACTGTSRVLVSVTRKPELLDKLCERVRAMKVGDGFTKGAQIGPLASQAQLDKVLEYVEVGKAEASLMMGGEQLQIEGRSGGYFVAPAIFDAVTPQMRIAREEIFGPVIAVMSFTDLGDAIKQVNATDYGLSASVLTQDLVSAQIFIRRVHSGVVKVNRPTTGNVINAPFGGVKWSSTNGYREAGREALEFFTQTKTVYLGY